MNITTQAYSLYTFLASEKDYTTVYAERLHSDNSIQPLKRTAYLAANYPTTCLLPSKART
jgi:hypothetical protein